MDLEEKVLLILLRRRQQHRRKRYFRVRYIIENKNESQFNLLKYSSSNQNMRVRMALITTELKTKLIVNKQ